MKQAVIVAGVALGLFLFSPLEAAKKQAQRAVSDVEREEGKLRFEERKLLERQIELQDRKKVLLEEKLKLLEDHEPNTIAPAPKVAEPKVKPLPKTPKKAEMPKEEELKPIVEKKVKKKSVPPPLPVFEPAVVPPSSGSKRVSDLPEGWEEEEHLPEGAVRIEELGKKKATHKPTSKPSPAIVTPVATPEFPPPPLDENVPPAAKPKKLKVKKETPPPEPVTPAEPTPAPPQQPQGKSDLPEGWEGESEIPAGYVPLERVRQYPSGGPPSAPTAAPASPSKGDAIGSPLLVSPPQQKKKVERTPPPEEKKPVKKQPKRWE